ncbi:MAG: class I SAM-dependent methyltransferase [Actinomycetota bacterium]
MRVPAEWQESKFAVDPRSGALRASRSAARLAASSRLVTDRAGAFYTQAIPEHAHGDLLDLGCGSAPMLGYYAKFVQNVTLVDWANSLHENPLLDIIADLNKPLELRDEAFDTVILSDVLEHIAEPQALLGEVARILKSDGGVLLLNVPFYYPSHEDPFDFYRYTRYSLARLCAAAGLEVVNIPPLGGLPEILIDLTSKILQQLPYLGQGLAAVVQNAGSWLVKYGPGRYASDRTANRFPLGYSLIAVKRRE